MAPAQYAVLSLLPGRLLLVAAGLLVAIGLVRLAVSRPWIALGICGVLVLLAGSVFTATLRVPAAPRARTYTDTRVSLADGDAGGGKIEVRAGPDGLLAHAGAGQGEVGPPTPPQTPAPLEPASPAGTQASLSSFSVDQTHDAPGGWDRNKLTVKGRVTLAFDPSTPLPKPGTAEWKRRRAEWTRLTGEAIAQRLTDYLDQFVSSPATPGEVRSALERLSTTRRQDLARELVARGHQTVRIDAGDSRHAGCVELEIGTTGAQLRELLLPRTVPSATQRSRVTPLAVFAAVGLVVVAYWILKASTRRTRAASEPRP